jgi:hypothetical protein
MQAGHMGPNGGRSFPISERGNTGGASKSWERLRNDDGMHKKLVDSFCPEEHQAFNVLSSEHQREGFLIVRAFAGTAAHNGDKDFAAFL